MSSKTESDRIDQLERDVERLKRALAAVVSGVDWSSQRGGRDAGVMREVCAEADAARRSEAREQRAAELEDELAEVRAA
jgi:hypothetical protein